MAAFCRQVCKLTALNPRPGHLGDICTIHFARWVKIPGTRDLLFFCNYGGSWESYLENLITNAHQGLTGVWSNTIGFPKTTNLFLEGATDGERFESYARQLAILTLATSADGLAELGLPRAGVETFPAALLAGMCGSGRDRILGDTHENAPNNW